MKTKEHAKGQHISGKGHGAQGGRVQAPKSSSDTQKKKALQSLGESQRVFEHIRNVLERTSDGFVALDNEMNYTYVNAQAGQMFGRKPEDLIGRNYWEEYPEAEGTPFAEAYMQALKSQMPIRFEDYYEPWDRWFENRIYPTPDGLNIFFTEITQRKQTENKIKYLTRLYATLSQINQCIVRIKDRQALFEGVCKVAVEFGQFHLAWIGLTDPVSGKVEIVAHAGAGEPYLQEVAVNFKDKASQNGPTTQAICQNTVVIVNDVQTDPRMKPWRKAVMHHGYRSLAAVPLQSGGEVIGVLDLYATEVGFFTKGDRSLLVELGADISFALDVMTAEADRQRSQERLEIQLQRLSALRAIDTAITSGLDLHLFLDAFVQHVVTQSGASAAAVSLFHPNMNELEFAASRGFSRDKIIQHRRSIADTCSGRAVLERRMIHITDQNAAELSIAEARMLSKEGFECLCAIPLITKGNVKGVLEVFLRSRFDPDPEWLEFMQTLAGQAAIAIADAELLKDLQRSNLELRFAYDETLEGWSRVMELRNQDTQGHSQRVTQMTLKLALLMGVDEAELLPMRRGALLHDIGKMGIPDHILLKPGPLTEQEWALVRNHPQYAYDTLVSIKFLRPALDIPYCHHEKWDGSGYPRGLKGEEIPLAARVFAVVDVYDVLICDQPYRKSWPKPKALEYIQSASGSHFDPQVVAEFLKMMGEEE